jgi:hypothetical protein
MQGKKLLVTMVMKLVFDKSVMPKTEDQLLQTSVFVYGEPYVGVVP